MSKDLKPRLRFTIEHASAPSRSHELRHDDGRRVRVFTREWREGVDPRREGLIYLSIQPFVREDGLVLADAVNPLWVGWTFPNAIEDRCALVLGPGWTRHDGRSAAA